MNPYEIETADNDARYVRRKAELEFCGLAHETRYTWVLSSFNLNGKSVLDFGCGSGYGAYMLSEKAKRVDGVDYSEKTIKFAKAKYSDENVSFFVMDVCSARDVFSIFKPKSYDVIVSFDVIEHIERYFDYLKNICRLLREDGILIIGCPNRLQLFNWNEKWNEYHFQEFSPYQLRKILSLYFRDVTLVSQDFHDAVKKEFARQRNFIIYKKRLRQTIRKVIPYQVRKAMKRHIIKSEPRKIYDYSDIEFLKEPGIEKLESAFGLIAVCRKPRKF